jgi:hypothetical protein
VKRFFYLAGLLAVAVILVRPVPAEKAAGTLLPARCPEGWAREGEVSLYTPDDLYKYIDGEAELYLPYGLEKAETVLYADPAHKGSGLVVNLFTMGSLLDAFGIYSNYRSTEAEPVKAGADGFVEEAQLMFYEGPYFVQIMTSGSSDQDSSLFRRCAAAVSQKLAGGAERPRELELLGVPGLVPRSERYYAGGLLGYAFLGRGLTAEVALKSGRAKAFVVLGNTAEAIKRALEAYGKQLKESKAAFHVSEVEGVLRLAATDPLYKGVLLRQSGRFAVGVAGLADPRDGEEIIAQLLFRLPRR